MMVPSGRNLLVLLISIIVLLIPAILLEHQLFRHTGGNIVYPLDNAFIDITVGRNLAFNKVWGISKYVFQPVSSSLLYPLVLAPLFFIAGEHIILPILANASLAILLLFLVQHALVRRKKGPLVQLTVLLSIIGLASLPILIVSGMGYLLPLFTCFLFVEELATVLEVGDTRLPRRIHIYGALMIAAGYEDVLVLIFACTLLILLQKRRQAITLFLISLSPALLFGSVSLLKGASFFPISLRPSLYPLSGVILAIVVALLGAALVRKWHLSTEPVKKTSVYRLSLTLLCLLTAPFLVRNITVLRHFERDSILIYEGEYRLAAFIHRYYKGASVGVNDIGAVVWFSEGKKLDFTGLISSDVAQIKKDHTWTPQSAEHLGIKYLVSLYMVSDPWFQPESLPEWSRVASWKFPDTQYHQGKTFSFYVRYPRDTARMLLHLRDYQKWLSDDIDVRYY